MFHLVDLPNLTILNASSGGASARTIVADDVFGIGIQAPPTLTASQALIYVSASSASTSSFAQLLSGGSPVVVTASAAITIAPFTWKQILLQSTSAEGADRTFNLTKTVQ